MVFSVEWKKTLGCVGILSTSCVRNCTLIERQATIMCSPVEVEGLLSTIYWMKEDSGRQQMLLDFLGSVFQSSSIE